MSTPNVTDINRHPSRGSSAFAHTSASLAQRRMEQLVAEFLPDNCLTGPAHGYDWVTDRFVVVEVNRNGNVYFDVVESIADYDPDLFDGGWTPTMIVDLHDESQASNRYEVNVKVHIELGNRIVQS